MRKINILKTIVDYLWIVTVPIGTLIILAFIPAVFFIDFSSSGMTFFDLELKNNTLYSKIILAVLAANSLLILYSFHLFRKVLYYFQQVKIFESEVITNFTKIGNLLIISGCIAFVIGIIARIYFKGSVSFSFGFNTNIIIIALGLFFQILSEAFKIAKKAKQENDLTI